MTRILAVDILGDAGLEDARLAFGALGEALGLAKERAARVQGIVLEAVHEILARHDAALVVAGVAGEAGDERLEIRVQGRDPRRLPQDAGGDALADLARRFEAQEADPPRCHVQARHATMMLAWLLDPARGERGAAGTARAAGEAADGRALAGALATIEHLQKELEREHATAQSLRDLMAAVAHGVRTPVGAAANAAALLQMGSRDEETVQVVAGIVARSAQAVLRLASDLDEIDRLDHGEVGLQKHPVDAVAIARRALADVESPAAARRVRLAFESGATEIGVRADEDRLVQVLDNLLLNAIDHSPEGETVGLRVDASDEAVVFGVDDRGRTPTHEELPHLFDRDGRRARSRRRGGLALGLAIARELVEAHGGTIQCEIRSGSGTSLRVSLPR